MTNISRRNLLSLGVAAAGSQILPSPCGPPSQSRLPSRVSSFSDLATPARVVWRFSKISKRRIWSRPDLPRRAGRSKSLARAFRSKNRASSTTIRPLTTPPCSSWGKSTASSSSRRCSVAATVARKATRSGNRGRRIVGRVREGENRHKCGNGQQTKSKCEPLHRGHLSLSTHRILRRERAAHSRAVVSLTPACHPSY